MKTIKRITVILAIMSFIGYQGFSQNSSTSNTQRNIQNKRSTMKVVPGKFVDNNNDGVCDNFQARMKNGHGANFVDQNGDGICDNCVTVGYGRGKLNCCGMGHQYRHGRTQEYFCRGGYGYRHR